MHYTFYANLGDEKVEDFYLQSYLCPDNVAEQSSVEDNSVYTDFFKGIEVQEKFYLIVIQSTVKCSEGLYPRANKVVEHLGWLDGQTS